MPELTIDRDIIYAQPDGFPLGLDIYRPAGMTGLPVIMIVHGGGWCVGDRQWMDDFARFLAEQDYLVATVSYRLAPVFPYPAACEDMLTAAAWLVEHAAEYGGVATRFGALGVSAGAHLVTWLATEPKTPLTCCASWAGPMDMRREPVTYPYRSYGLAFMGACIHDAPDAYVAASPLFRLTSAAPPLLLVHGLADEVVPVDHARWMLDRAKEIGAPVEAMLLEGMVHTVGSKDDPSTAAGWEALTKFFRRHLSPQVLVR